MVLQTAGALPVGVDEVRLPSIEDDAIQDAVAGGQRHYGVGLPPNMTLVE